MDRKDCVAGVFLLGLGVFALVSALHYPVGTLHQPDTAFFPILLSTLLIIFSLISIGKSLLPKPHPQGGLHLGPHWKKLIPAFLGFGAYVVVFQPVGYIVSTLLLIVFFVKLVNPSWKAAFSISILCTALSYFVCVRYLHTPLPQGILPF